MTLEELRKALTNDTYQDNIQIAPHMVVGNVEKFLTKQFKDCEEWKKDIAKCPSYDRLLIFYRAVKENTDERPV